MAANIRCIMRAKAPYGQGITKLKVNLTPTQDGTPWQSDEVNNAPYVFRSVPMGNREWNKLVGGTVAWNQPAIVSISSSTVYGITRTVSGNSVAYSGQSEQSTNFSCASIQNLVQGHVYYISLGNVALPSGCRISVVAGDKRSEAIYKPSTAGFGVQINSGTQVDFTITPWGIDLTLALPSGIADYVYSLEQSQAGSGIQWLKDYDLIDDNYHAYSAGSLESVNVSAHVMRDADNNIIETYPADSSVTLRGMLETDANGNLYYNGDEYLPDGTVKRKYGEVDLGTLTWATNGTDGVYGLVPGKKSGSNNAFCNALTKVSQNTIAAQMPSGTFKTYSANSNVAIKLSGITVENAATMLSGIMMLYELATQTTESADPYTELQTCDPDGTEEWTDYGVEQGTRDYAVPVGHESTYAMAYPIEGVDSFTVTANDGTTHTYPVTLSEEIYRGYVDMLTGEAVSDMASIAEYNGETIGEPWLSSLDEYAAGTTPTYGAQVVYPITPEEVTAAITGDPSELSGVVSATSTEGTVDWSELSEIGIKCIMKRKNPFQ